MTTSDERQSREWYGDSKCGRKGNARKHAQVVCHNSLYDLKTCNRDFLQPRIGLEVSQRRNLRASDISLCGGDQEIKVEYDHVDIEPPNSCDFGHGTNGALQG